MMLQFWKKSGLTLAKKDKAGNKAPMSPSKLLKPADKSPTLRNNYLHRYAGPLSAFSDEEMVASVTGKIKITQRSQLSKSLSEVLRDKCALGYFIKYLESQRALPLIKFWLDAESFRTRVSSLALGAGRAAAREDLEPNAPKPSPQRSLPSIGTDCDPLLKSPARSVDSSTSCSLHGYQTQLGADVSSSAIGIESHPDVTSMSAASEERTDNLTVRHNQTVYSDALPKESASISEQSASTSEPSASVPSAVDEAVRIYREHLACASRQRVPLDTETRERVIAAVCQSDGVLEPETFDDAQSAAFHLLDSEHFNSFLRSDYHGKHQIDVLTSGKVTIEDILYNDTAFFYFMEFMEQEGNQSLVEFWIAAVNFQQHLAAKEGSYDAAEAQNDAMILYDKYFSMQATCPLGFGDRIRLAVEQNICREEGPLPDCFQLPISVVQLVLEKNFLSSFLSSQLNMKYLTELVNTIQASPALLKKHRKTGLESSSEWSISAQNTLLASEDASQPATARCGEMCIDSRQLNDPDALWRRRRHNGLRFGRINHMGRFETDVEPEPDRKEESRIARAVKKLVNMEEDKAKEEMAWQIAEMIVKDITSLTLGSSRNESLT